MALRASAPGRVPTRAVWIWLSPECGQKGQFLRGFDLNNSYSIHISLTIYLLKLSVPLSECHNICGRYRIMQRAFRPPPNIIIRKRYVNEISRLLAKIVKEREKEHNALCVFRFVSSAYSVINSPKACLSHWLPDTHLLMLIYSVKQTEVLTRISGICDDWIHFVFRSQAQFEVFLLSKGLQMFSHYLRKAWHQTVSQE